MAREQIVNNAITDLTGAITDSETSVDVSDASSFPSEGDFIVIIDQEIIKVTGVSGDTFTCVRGRENTTPAPHGGSAVVAHILTAGSLLQHLRDTVPTFSEPTASLVNSLTNAAGTILTSSSFTWVNQGGAAVVDLASGGIVLTGSQTAGDSLRILKKASPSPPYTIVAAIRPHLHHNTTCHLGIGFRESSTGKLITLGLVKANEHAVYRWTNQTTFLDDSLFARETFPYNHCMHWLKIEDDSTNLKFFTSSTGLIWHQLASQSRTAHMAGGPDEVLFYVNNASAAASFNIHMLLAHWSEG